MGIDEFYGGRQLSSSCLVGPALGTLELSSGVAPGIQGYSCGNCTRTTLGLMLMFGFEHECAWPNWLLAILYIVLIGWTFIGIAIVSNIFMEGIERITSKKYTRAKRGGAKGEKESVLLWNPTVANLTLLALGSSAPEIILAVLEILLNDFHSGELGPGTIVGSAAFNMLMISAVCISAVPSPQVRKIEQFGVYIFTAVVSIWAYIWLIVILQLNTPNVIDIWEVSTWLSFPSGIWPVCMWTLPCRRTLPYPP